MFFLPCKMYAIMHQCSGQRICFVFFLFFCCFVLFCFVLLCFALLCFFFVCFVFASFSLCFRFHFHSFRCFVNISKLTELCISYVNSLTLCSLLHYLVPIFSQLQSIYSITHKIVLDICTLHSFEIALQQYDIRSFTCGSGMCSDSPLQRPWNVPVWTERSLCMNGMFLAWKFFAGAHRHPDCTCNAPCGLCTVSFSTQFKISVHLKHSSLCTHIGRSFHFLSSILKSKVSNYSLMSLENIRFQKQCFIL